MSCTLHVHKKHVIEYGDTTAFNWSREDINSLFNEFVEGYWGNDEEYGCYSKSIEMPRDNFKAFLDWFKNDKERQKKFNENDYELPSNISDVQYLIQKFEDLYNESDPDSDYIYFDWF